jgi:hypothetical protein
MAVPVDVVAIVEDEVEVLLGQVLERGVEAS